MRLLPKSEITKQKAVVQQQTVEEGKKLAMTIDRLREVVAEEESSLEKFRSETLKQIHKETSAAAATRDELLGEVAQLELRKKEALEPVYDLWGAVEEVNKQAEYERQAVAELLREAEQKVQAADAAEKQAAQALYVAETIKERHQSLLNEVIQKKQEAEQIVTEATEKYQQSAIMKEQTETSLSARKQELEALSEQLQKKEEQLEQERLRQQEERVRLADREQTLEREFTRLRNKS